ncbi:hypothetical protein Deiofobo_0071 [Pseudomonas phage Deifobo]|nr:hypothetical protein Deiofobo_0071 [Pseudomonas phage Deifobo]
MSEEQKSYGESYMHAKTYITNWNSWENNQLQFKNIKDAIDVVAELGINKCVRLGTRVRFKEYDELVFQRIKYYIDE